MTGESRRVLVVDDDAGVIALARAVLETERVRVEGAMTAGQALASFAGSAPDLVLLDIVLPDGDGLDVLQRLRAGGAEVPVVIITSHASMDTAIEAMRRGAYDFLAKPFRSSQLQEAVRTVLNGGGHGGTPADDPTLARAEDEPEVDDAEDRIVGRSPAIVEVYKKIGRVAPTNATVVVTGESGTGKELVARVIHRHSRRSRGPFVAVNCAAIPESLLESELFGHARGAFTGAVRRAQGRVERANRGTLLLDEIADMSFSLQSKILRLLEQREVEPLGDAPPAPVDVRIVAATNRDLEAAVAARDFREDLYYRLAVVNISLPPLRERPGDIRLLADHWISRLSIRLGRRIDRVEPELYERLEAYTWPGNVRQLRNVLERSLVLGHGPVLRSREVPPLDESAWRPPGATLDELAADGVTLEGLETRYLERILRRTHGNRTRAAELLGIHRNTLRRKIDRYGLDSTF